MTAAHEGATLWFTGLPSSGKSTIAHRVETLLLDRGCRRMYWYTHEWLMFQKP